MILIRRHIILEVRFILTNWKQILDPNQSIYSGEEEQFKTLMRELFDLRVKETLLEGGIGSTSQYRLSVWIEQPYTKPINDIVSELGQDIVNLYINSFFLNNTANNEIDIYLSLKDFKQDRLTYAYGHAEKSIKDALRTKYKHYKLDVLMHHYGDMLYLECPQVYMESLIKDQDEIKQMCYDKLKEHDPYGVVELSDICIEFLAKETSDTVMINDIRMQNRY